MGLALGSTTNMVETFLAPSPLLAGPRREVNCFVLGMPGSDAKEELMVAVSKLRSEIPALSAIDILVVASPSTMISASQLLVLSLLLVFKCWFSRRRLPNPKPWLRPDTCSGIEATALVAMVVEAMPDADTPGGAFGPASCPLTAAAAPGVPPRLE